jgi:hypothetical protein
MDGTTQTNTVVQGLNEDTPTETYEIGGKTVYVKRDDLMGSLPFLPPWGKIGAINALVDKYIDKNKPLTHLSVDGSWSGWVLASICEGLGIEFHYSHPDSKKFNRDILKQVENLYPACKFNPVKPNMMAIMYNVLRNQAKEEEWQMLPYAFNHEFYKNYLAERVQQVDDQFGPFDNLVVSSGSGVSVAGLARGFFADEMKKFWNPKITKRIWTTAVSSESSIRRTLKENNLQRMPIKLRVSEFDFQDRMENYKAPFPCNQFWDIKQWHWLENNIEKLDGEILFWNLGGIYEY